MERISAERARLLRHLEAEGATVWDLKSNDLWGDEVTRAELYGHVRTSGSWFYLTTVGQMDLAAATCPSVQNSR